MKTLYFELRDMLCGLADDLRHQSLSFKSVEPEHSYIHPINCNDIEIDGKSLGMMGIVHPTVGKRIDKKAAVVFAEIDIDVLAESKNLGIVYEEPSKFPPMEYDLSLELPQELFFADLSKCWENAGDILKSTRIVDTYDSDEIHSITIRFVFGSNERTLESTEVQSIIDGIVERLGALGVKLR